MLFRSPGVAASYGDSEDTLRAGTIRGDGDGYDEGGGGSLNYRAGETGGRGGSVSDCRFCPSVYITGGPWLSKKWCGH